MDEEAKYLDRELAGFRAKGQGTQGRNYYGDRNRHRSSKRNGDWNREDDYKEKSDRYIPPSGRDTLLRIELILPKLVKGQ